MRKHAARRAIPDVGFLYLGSDVEWARPETCVMETTRLARIAEESGYQSFWLTEHHHPQNTTPAPEALLPAVACATERIRLGLGCAILPYHHPYRLTRYFHTLSGLFGPRFELGLGRGPGATVDVRREFVANGSDSDDFWARAGRVMASAERTGVLPHWPTVRTALSVWIMGTSVESAREAGRIGANFAYGAFLVNNDPLGSRAEEIQHAFRSSALADARFAVAELVLCTRRTEEANRLEAQSRAEGALPHRYIGTPAQVRAEIHDALGHLDVDLFLTGCAKTISMERQIISCRLLANSLKLCRAEAVPQ